MYLPEQVMVRRFDMRWYGSWSYILWRCWLGTFLPGEKQPSTTMIEILKAPEMRVVEMLEVEGKDRQDVGAP